MRKELCSLSFDEAVNIITKHDGPVMSKFGVWNNYGETTIDKAANDVKNAPYGADVSIDTDTNTLYVSMPSSGDMW